MGPGVAGPAAVRALSLGLTPSGMRALHGRDHPPLASHAVNALKDQTIGGVPSLTPWIVTIPGRRPVPPRPRGFREPPASCSLAMQSGQRPPQTTGGNREPEGRYQGFNGNSAPRAALPPLAAGASALPRGTLAMRPPIWRCSRDTESTPAGRLGAAASPPGSGPPLGGKFDLPLRASVVELLPPPWRGVCPARAPLPSRERPPPSKFAAKGLSCQGSLPSRERPPPSMSAALDVLTP